MDQPDAAFSPLTAVYWSELAVASLQVKAAKTTVVCECSGTFANVSAAHRWLLRSAASISFCSGTAATRIAAAAECLRFIVRVVSAVALRIARVPVNISDCQT